MEFVIRRTSASITNRPTYPVVLYGPVYGLFSASWFWSAPRFPTAFCLLTLTISTAISKYVPFGSVGTVCFFFSFGLKHSAYCCWTFVSRWNRGDWTSSKVVSQKSNTLHKTERNWGMILWVCHNERHLSYQTWPYDPLMISQQLYCSFDQIKTTTQHSQTGPTWSCLLRSAVLLSESQDVWPTGPKALVIYTQCFHQKLMKCI